MPQARRLPELGDGESQKKRPNYRRKDRKPDEDSGAVGTQYHSREGRGNDSNMRVCFHARHGSRSGGEHPDGAPRPQEYYPKAEESSYFPTKQF